MQIKTKRYNAIVCTSCLPYALIWRLLAYFLVLIKTQPKPAQVFFFARNINQAIR